MEIPHREHGRWIGGVLVFPDRVEQDWTKYLRESGFEEMTAWAPIEVYDAMTVYRRHSDDLYYIEVWNSDQRWFAATATSQADMLDVVRSVLPIVEASQRIELRGRQGIRAEKNFHRRHGHYSAEVCGECDPMTVANREARRRQAANRPKGA